MDEGYDVVNLDRARALLAGRAPRCPCRRPPSSSAAARARRRRRTTTSTRGRRCRGRRHHARRERLTIRDDPLRPVALLALSAWSRSRRCSGSPGSRPAGTFDADQGHDMPRSSRSRATASCRSSGRRPPSATSTTAPSTTTCSRPRPRISNGDPVAVTAFLALLGIGAVALTWWLGRAIGRARWPALIAGRAPRRLPGRRSSESTFIWNPNPIAFFAVLSLAAAWRARTGRRARRGGPLALGAAGVVVQLHVLGRRVPDRDAGARACSSCGATAAVAGPIVAGLALVALLFVPLARPRAADTASPRREACSPTSRAASGPAGGPDLRARLHAPARRRLAARRARDGRARCRGHPARGDGRRRSWLAPAPRRAAPRRTAVRWLVGIARLEHDRAGVRGAVAAADRRRPAERPLPRVPRPDRGHPRRRPGCGDLFERASAAWRSTRRPVALVAVRGRRRRARGARSRRRSSASRRTVDPDGGWPAMQAAGAADRRRPPGRARST